jgi:AcrR family transcriptional regulator
MMTLLSVDTGVVNDARVGSGIMVAASASGTAPVERERRGGREAMRATVLEEARRIVVGEGPDALTVRRLADRLGCSTIIVYRMFDGKQGVVDALYLDAFGRLEADLSALRRTGDPRADLLRLTVAYRNGALERPDDYRLMFDRGYLGIEPSEAARERTNQSFAILCAAVARLGDLGPHTPQYVAGLVWSAVHGAVLLELGGLLPSVRQPHGLRLLVGAVLDGLHIDGRGQPAAEGRVQGRRVRDSVSTRAVEPGSSPA